MHQAAVPARRVLPQTHPSETAFHHRRCRAESKPALPMAIQPCGSAAGAPAMSVPYGTENPERSSPLLSGLDTLLHERAAATITAKAKASISHAPPDQNSFAGKHRRVWNEIPVDASATVAATHFGVVA